ncbi:MAG: 50S ribosomal protein L21 [bacterium]
MYAIIESGGKQYKVTKGEILNVDKLDKKIGETMELDKVLLISDNDKVMVGNPVVKNARVVLEVVKLAKGKKVVVFKYKRKKGYRKTKGHRQQYTTVRVTDIKLN